MSFFPVENRLLRCFLNPCLLKGLVRGPRVDTKKEAIFQFIQIIQYDNYIDNSYISFIIGL